MMLLPFLISAQAANVGLGLALGSPTGVTLKIMTSHKAGFDLLVGEMWHYWDKDDVLVSADYVVTMSRLASGEVDLDFYLGGGGNVWLGRWTGNVLAAEMPLGLSLTFGPPVEVFVEAVPVLFVLPFGEFGVGGSVGFRYYF